jgi:hypothetical protein
MNFNLAILSVLAKWPERRTALDEVRREVEIIMATGDQTEQMRRFSALGEIDIFQSGLVSRDDAGLQITDAGLSLLRSLESSNAASLEVSSTPISPALRMIDDLSTQERLRIFDLDLRGPDGGTDDGAESAGIGTPDATSETGAADLVDKVESQVSDRTSEGNPNQPSPDGSDRTGAIEPPDAAPRDAPAFLRRSFGSKIQEPGRNSSQLSTLLAFIAAKIQTIPGLRRRHFAGDVSNRKTERPVGSVGGGAFAFLSLVVAVTCIGAEIALGQINSLKSEIAALHRELLSLRERLGRLEQIEKTKRGSDQDEAQNKSNSEKSKPDGESDSAQTALNLSREEIQLIKDYIKLAPSAGSTAPAINVGDPIGGATIPLPSPITEKVPRLIGARFTTRNGAIIISTKNSRRADAVLAPN